MHLNMMIMMIECIDLQLSVQEKSQLKCITKGKQTIVYLGLYALPNLCVYLSDVASQREVE